MAGFEPGAIVQVVFDTPMSAIGSRLDEVPSRVREPGIIACSRSVIPSLEPERPR